MRVEKTMDLMTYELWTPWRTKNFPIDLRQIKCIHLDRDSDL